MDEVIGYVHCDLEGRDECVRTQETNLGIRSIIIHCMCMQSCDIVTGNLIADIAHRATKVDCVILNSGILRSNAIHEAGDFKLKVST